MLALSDKGYILHIRKYSDSQSIVKVLTQSYGLISAMARVNQKKRSTLKTFSYMALQWHGGGELKKLTLVEDDGQPHILLFGALFCAIYLNELLTKLLKDGETQLDVFPIYHEAIQALTQAHESRELQEVILRRFEFQLLGVLGYGLSFSHDIAGAAIDTSQGYVLDSTRGFTACLDSEPRTDVLSGQALSDIGIDQWNQCSLRVAKYISRVAFKPLLGSYQLKSRELFS
ncbi:MAG: DNA repair protein RecO (recombination protein O) [Flavobacteriales bacterium]|jgi:DNA repair protein RecO (recombination protein O)